MSNKQSIYQPLPWISLLIAGCAGSFMTTTFMLSLYYFKDNILFRKLGYFYDYWPSHLPRPNGPRCNSPWSSVAAARCALPTRVILVRHGESEGNADKTLYRSKPDNQIELTERGFKQAHQAGQRLKKIIQENEKIDYFCSPFLRTIQTCRLMRQVIPGQTNEMHLEPRIREQEFGNLQGDEFKNYREQQKDIGRFWYRFPTGESGADVFDRTKQWWDSCIMGHNLRPGRTRVDTVVVVTHGLTMRIILMQLFGWSPSTVNTVWNADNCDMYILKLDHTRPGRAPYVLDKVEGDFPRSSKELVITFVDKSKMSVTLEDYITIPPPRSRQLEYVKELLQKQHGIDPLTVKDVDFFSKVVAK